VIGTSDERGRKVMGDIYRPLSLNQAPLMFTARCTAEMIKYAANAFLATKITFINGIADPLVFLSLTDAVEKCRAVVALLSRKGFWHTLGRASLLWEPFRG
jgi:UDP-glucose 6-dehydrogenase